MRSVKNLFSWSLPLLSLLFLEAGCRGLASEDRGNSSIKIMDKDNKTVLIESFELRANESLDDFYARTSKALKLDEKKDFATNPYINPSIRKFLASPKYRDGKKATAVTQLSNKLFCLRDKSEECIEDPSKLENGETLTAIIYADYENYLEKAWFEQGISLEGAILIKANLSRAMFVRVILNRAILEEANLTKAYIASPNFDNANLKKAILRNTEYKSDTHFTEADLTGADLTGADFTTAELHIKNAIVSQDQLRTAKGITAKHRAEVKEPKN